MNKKKIILSAITILTAILIAAGTYLYLSTNSEKEIVHYHTGFLIIRDGVILDLSGDEYMYIAPCGIDPKKKTPSTPAERVHLHNRIGDVLHVHHAEAKIEDVLMSLNMYESSTEWFAYTENGEQITTDSIIPDTESIAIANTALDNAFIENLEFPSAEHITTIEQGTLENCGS